MASEIAISGEVYQAVAVVFAQSKLAGDPTELELTCQRSSGRARCRVLNEPVTVHLLSILGATNYG